MSKDREIHRRKKPVVEIGRQVPSNLKFGVIVAVAIFWAEFLRSVLSTLFALLDIITPILADLIIALVVTAVAYFILLSYRKIQFRLKKVKV